MLTIIIIWQHYRPSWPLASMLLTVCLHFLQSLILIIFSFGIFLSFPPSSSYMTFFAISVFHYSYNMVQLSSSLCSYFKICEFPICLSPYTLYIFAIFHLLSLHHHSIYSLTLSFPSFLYSSSRFYMCTALLAAVLCYKFVFWLL